MPPGGRRGAKPARKWTREPQLGDLVLAKVKGYPPWPAKVPSSSLPPSSACDCDCYCYCYRYCYARVPSLSSDPFWGWG